MPAVPSPPTPVRSAAVVNEEIRELASRLALGAVERARLVELWAEWQVADARERRAREAELAA